MKLNNMKKYELTPPKTKGSIREFDLDEDIINLLKKHKANQAKSKLANRHKLADNHNENFIFCRNNGYPFAPANVLQRMKKIVCKTAFKKNATPHFFVILISV
ncbi:hypothetical protein J6TS2_49110 [Heyndrickxia sporothermodurans]|nr:hypothetical protein J6TS2_49110 [Heyndrickxia sporothermodurans]